MLKKLGRGLGDRMVNRALEHEEMLVRRPGSDGRLWARVVVRLGIGMAALLASTMLDGEPVGMLASVLLGGMVGQWAGATAMRAAAYRNGWLDGRMGMIRSLTEASRRGLTLDDWVESQIEVDFQVLGRGSGHE